MIQLSVPARLYQFKQHRLPLGCPVRWRGADGAVVGRTFLTESYDVACPGHPVALGVPLAELIVNMKELASGPK